VHHDGEQPCVRARARAVIDVGGRDVVVGSSALKLKAAHLRLDDEAVVLVPLRAEFNQLPTDVRLRILEELIAAAKADRLQGEVIPVWARADGSFGFLAEPRLHPAMKPVTLQRVLANLNRALTVAQASPELAANVASLDELLMIQAAVNRVLARRPRPPAPPPAAAQRSATDEIMYRPPAVAVDEPPPADPFADLPTAPVSTGSWTPSGRFASAPVEPSAGRTPSNPALQVFARTYTPMPSTPSTTPGPMPGVGEPMRAPSRSFNEPRRASKELPMRLVTMLFSDIVGSTELKQRLGEHRAMEIIQWHHATLRDLLATTQSGEEVSTAGDSFFIVFASPSDAVRFALLVQARLRVGPGLGFVVHDRIGIHVGEVFMTSETVAGKVRDFYGMQVDTCARVMSLGGADQILMTRFAADNARQSLRGHNLPGLNPLQWTCHGFYGVKGVDEPIEVFEVGEKGLAPMHTPSPDKRLRI
jgi:class 3 adenylate cyclase